MTVGDVGGSRVCICVFCIEFGGLFVGWELKTGYFL